MAETTLPARLRAAAEVLEELSALAGYKHLAYIGWNADSLRREAEVLEQEVPGA